MAKTKGKSGRAAEESPLDQSPSHLLHRVLQLALDLYSTETGPDGLTQRQYAVLTAVAHNPGLTQTDLVRSTGIDRSTLADMVARMISKGLLERERSSLDARANTVSLTDAGRAELNEAKPKVDAADKQILALLPRGKRNSFISGLKAFARAGEEAAAAASGDATDGRKKKKKKDPKRDKAPKAEKTDKKKNKKINKKAA
ncbi:MAG TPA: MarR family winged helix-turn-helix transcriptional regulator [Caulobacteraceae bacterium]|jgi:DNA-binding MarR family transcriptional regulator|nr:MarR family winged helix-turn-helix transcriptional regulator [Caulobacteraceae bacterium]